ncbi:hypothetical protein [Pseudoalteromonas sp. G4]|uniref:hypothetical protein n=1 Tax=Pseudoalteromonas sp. G4 TaxID=2992761 RepID=UPI00237DB3C1|nr:hypothetical protein [Pseudoalteromonas sp. G4]MDE3272891.1 hypothetical protein [Pseudoalteromonas sp. G4]
MNSDWLCSLFDIELLQLKQKKKPLEPELIELKKDLQLVFTSHDIKLEFCTLSVPFEVESKRLKVNNQGLTSSQKRALWQTIWQQLL